MHGHVGITRRDERVDEGAVLAVSVGEQFDGLDVGIGIDRAAHGERAGVGELHGAFADLRNVFTQDDRIEHQPHRKWRKQPEAGRGKADGRNDDADRNPPQAAGEDEDDIPHGRAGIEHLVGDAAGEIVLEIGEAVAQDVPVHLAAYSVCIGAGKQRGVKPVIDKVGDKPQHQRDGDIACQRWNELRPCFGRCGRGIDDIYDVLEEQRRDGKACGGHGVEGEEERDDLFLLAREVPDVRHQF